MVNRFTDQEGLGVSQANQLSFMLQEKRLEIRAIWGGGLGLKNAVTFHAFAGSI